jgi:hypothetical protein
MGKDKNYAFNLDDENLDPDKNKEDDSVFEGEIPERIEWLDDIQGGDFIEDEEDDDELDFEDLEKI